MADVLRKLYAWVLSCPLHFELSQVVCVCPFPLALYWGEALPLDRSQKTLFSQIFGMTRPGIEPSPSASVARAQLTGCRKQAY